MAAAASLFVAAALVTVRADPLTNPPRAPTSLATFCLREQAQLDATLAALTDEECVAAHAGRTHIKEQIIALARRLAGGETPCPVRVASELSGLDAVRTCADIKAAFGFYCHRLKSCEAARGDTAEDASRQTVVRDRMDDARGTELEPTESVASTPPARRRLFFILAVPFIVTAGCTMMPACCANPVLCSAAASALPNGGQPNQGTNGNAPWTNPNAPWVCNPYVTSSPLFGGTPASSLPPCDGGVFMRPRPYCQNTCVASTAPQAVEAYASYAPAASSGVTQTSIVYSSTTLDVTAR